MMKEEIMRIMEEMIAEGHKLLDLTKDMQDLLDLTKDMHELIVEGHELLELNKKEWHKGLEDLLCKEDEYDGKYDDLMERRERLGDLYDKCARKWVVLRTTSIRAAVEKLFELKL